MTVATDLSEIGMNPIWASLIAQDMSTSWTPSYSAEGSLTWTGVTTTIARYVRLGNMVLFFLAASGTLGGTAANELYFSAPETISAAHTTAVLLPMGGHTVDGASGTLGGVVGSIVDNSTISVTKGDNSNYSTSGAGSIRVFGIYEAA